MIAKVIANKGAIAPMRDLLTKLLKTAPKQTHRGFTLIELLIAMVIAAIVITPLLGFMANILNRDRIEQAKANSEAEIQAALDYIAQDLEQAIYIYNAKALDANATTDPDTSGIKDQIPPTASAAGCGTAIPDCTPVLVFWKRETEKHILPLPPTPPSTVPSTCPAPPPDPAARVCDDTFVYSLVAYYLVKGNTENGKWSDTARIARFQIKDGVVNPNDPVEANGTTPKYIAGKRPSSGYQEFKLKGPGNTLRDKMDLWRNSGSNYTDDSAVTLIDFVDKGTTAPIQNCPTTTTQRVPSNTNIRGFYACVDSTNNIAQVFIRGNALARINDTNSYSAGNSTYFPAASVQVEGRGFLGVN